MDKLGLGLGLGPKTWILTADLDAVRSPPAPKGVRLLPPHDPYTQLRDRETAVDKQYHRDVWRTVLRGASSVGVEAGSY